MLDLKVVDLKVVDLKLDLKVVSINCHVNTC